MGKIAIVATAAFVALIVVPVTFSMVYISWSMFLTVIGVL